MSGPTIPVARSPEAARLGDAFRAMRKARGLSLTDMAKALQCSINTVRWHEAGATLFRADMMERAAGHLQCTVDELMTGPSETMSKRREKE